jgi:hypothetical protein
VTPRRNTIAPLLKQAKAIAWARLKQKLLPLLSTGALTVNEGDLSVHVRHNGATIRLFGGDNPDALRGVRLDGVVIDEVAQIKPEVWNEVIQPALSDRLGWAMFIGTPSGVNLFSELYYRAQGGEDGWKAALWTVAKLEDTVGLFHRDILKEIKNVLGRRLRLDSVAQGTIGRGKIGHGLEAQTWWAEGKFDQVREYCLDDVKLTKEIYDYARKNNSIKYMDYEGPREIKIDASKWEAGDSTSMTHTLPF